MADIAWLNSLVIEFRELSLSDEALYNSILSHFSLIAPQSGWPEEFEFEEYKWRAEYFLLSHEALLMLSREKSQENQKKLKYYSLLLFQNYVRNVEYQMESFEKNSGKLYEEDIDGEHKPNPKHIKCMDFYGCVNKRYPLNNDIRSLADQNKESQERRSEFEIFSKMRSRLRKEVDEAIDLSMKRPSMPNMGTVLKVMRNKVEKNHVAKITNDEYERLWYWEDISNSRMSLMRFLEQQT